jgi:hypothetical protein
VKEKDLVGVTQGVLGFGKAKGSAPALCLTVTRSVVRDRDSEVSYSGTLLDILNEWITCLEVRLAHRVLGGIPRKLPFCLNPPHQTPSSARPNWHTGCTVGLARTDECEICLSP